MCRMCIYTYVRLCVNANMCAFVRVFVCVFFPSILRCCIMPTRNQFLITIIILLLIIRMIIIIIIALIIVIIIKIITTTATTTAIIIVIIITVNTPLI